MPDYFSVLGETRRPWLDPELLKQKFLTLSATVHPDRVHMASAEDKTAAQRSYTDLNQAYQHLRSPKERLQHLLELETGSKPQQVQQVPANLMGFFFEVGQLFQQVDAFLAEKARTTSPLLQVELFEKAQDWAERLKSLLSQLNARQQQLESELRRLDEQWTLQGERGTILGRLEELCRLFSYFSRWQSQVQEKILQLTL